MARDLTIPALACQSPSVHGDLLRCEYASHAILCALPFGPTVLYWGIIE
jgi:hypothetical protein